jgi:hypothetical protein
VTRDAYSHEVSSAGFWPGGAIAPYQLFYSYAYPEPKAFADAKVQPASARYDTTLREFILPYDDMRQADDPERTLLAFLQSTYAAAADLGAWDRRSLEVPSETLRAVGAAGVIGCRDPSPRPSPCRGGTEDKQGGNRNESGRAPILA